MHKLLSLSRTLPSSSVLGAVVLCATSLVAVPAFAQQAAATTKATAAPTKAAAPTATTETGATKQPRGAEPKEEAAPADESAESEAAPAGPTDEQREEARQAFEAGSKAYEEGSYVDAARAFQKAYSIIPSPHAEYWIALSLDKGDSEGKNPAAVAKAYQIFLTNPGASHVGADEVAQAKARYDQLRGALPGTVTVATTPAGASVAINGQAQEGVTPITFEIPAGTYQVTVSLEGYDDQTVEVTAEGGLTLEQQIEMKETVVPPPVAPVVATTAAPEPEKKSIVPAIVTLGLGGAGLISGTVFGIMALNSKHKFNDNPTTGNADAAERNALIADMSFGIALTLGITGIVLLTAHDEPAPATAKKQSPKSEFAFAPYASPRGGGATARLTF